jgi:peroxiredoxin family protein
MIAAILASGEPERLYTGLSLLVTSAAEGKPARGLVSFGALGPMLDDEWLAAESRGALRRTLLELRKAAEELEDCKLWACSAALEVSGMERSLAEERLDGVMSTPQFLREVEGASLVVV